MADVYPSLPTCASFAPWWLNAIRRFRDTPPIDFGCGFSSWIAYRELDVFASFDTNASWLAFHSFIRLPVHHLTRAIAVGHASDVVLIDHAGARADVLGALARGDRRKDRPAIVIVHDERPMAPAGYARTVVEPHTCIYEDLDRTVAGFDPDPATIALALSYWGEYTTWLAMHGQPMPGNR